MKLGVPFSTYIVVLELGIFSAVLAMQCRRRLDGSLYSRAAHEISSLRGLWRVIYLLGAIAWLPLLVLPFLQFKILTAAAYVFGGAVISALAVGAYFGMRREIDELMIVNRISAVIAFAVAALLWLQALQG